MTVSGLFKRILGTTAEHRAASAPSKASAPGLQVVSSQEQGATTAPPAPWEPRGATFWPEHSAQVVKRLRNEWHEHPERANWPDATDLMKALANPPEALIRQLPAAAIDAIALCDNAKVSRSDLAEKLGQDPSLVQGLLRQANGSFYGAGLKQVIRVDAAIDRVGIKATRAVVLASCVDGLLSKPGGKYDSMLGSVWGHMVNTAPLARVIAPAFGANPEEAFAVAVLHDVGKLVIFDAISGLRVAKRGPVRFPEEWLLSLLTQLHESLGAVALQRWGLGASAADTIGAHHRLERPSCIHPLAETLFVAERVEHAIRRGQRFDFEQVWTLGELNGDLTMLRGILGRYIKAAA